MGIKFGNPRKPVEPYPKTYNVLREALFRGEGYKLNYRGFT
jgi:hypothetical protein